MSTSIKPTLEFVCDILCRLGIPNITSEMLRQSKFNSSNPLIIYNMWRLLHGLCVLKSTSYNHNAWTYDRKQEYNNGANTSVSADEVLSSSGLEQIWNQSTFEECVAYIRVNLIRWGILGDNEWFYKYQENPTSIPLDVDPKTCVFLNVLLAQTPFPTDFIQNNSITTQVTSAVLSRELLLTVGWLISTKLDIFAFYLSTVVDDASRITALPPYDTNTMAFLLSSRQIPPSVVALNDKLRLIWLNSVAEIRKLQRSQTKSKTEQTVPKPLDFGGGDADVSVFDVHVRTRCRQIVSAVYAMRRLLRALPQLKTVLKATSTEFIGVQEEIRQQQREMNEKVGVVTKGRGVGGEVSVKTSTQDAIINGFRQDKTHTGMLADLGLYLHYWQSSHGGAVMSHQHELMWWEWMASVSESHTQEQQSLCDNASNVVFRHTHKRVLIQQCCRDDNTSQQQPQPQLEPQPRLSASPSVCPAYTVSLSYTAPPIAHTDVVPFTAHNRVFNSTAELSVNSLVASLIEAAPTSLAHTNPSQSIDTIEIVADRHQPVHGQNNATPVLHIVDAKRGVQSVCVTEWGDIASANRQVMHDDVLNRIDEAGCKVKQ